ncbi:MAG: tetratricopeptide repeat protein, partial [Akkermansiaceae bacterium]|nr:tetratricopeptide repeat protein [Akkermansiaceae bacterium]
RKTPPKTEAAFKECIKKFPNGEHTKRCHLGIGRAGVMQNTDEKKNAAIEAFKIAAQDPKLRSEAGLSLGQVYTDLKRFDEAMVVFKSLMGSDISTPQQTTAAVEVIGLLADSGKTRDVANYLDRLKNQSGIRNSIAWFANQLIARGDDLLSQGSYETALTIYRSIPPRSQILEIQTNTLNEQRQDLKLLQSRLDADKNKPVEQQSRSAAELANMLKPAIEISEQALKVIQEKSDLDAALIMRRGRCLYNLNRFEEALLCFRTIRLKYATSSEARAAAYGEIVLLSKLENLSDMKARCDDYIRKYPDDEKAEQVASIAGEVLVKNEQWREVQAFYSELESRFPNSPNLDSYIFRQGVAQFQDGRIREAIPFFEKFKKNYPQSPSFETALYYIALCNFLTGEYKPTMAACKEYLATFPDGIYEGDIRYRLAFIDSNDKSTDQTDKIIRDLSTFIEKRPNDSAAGSVLCLLADTYKKKKTNKADELGKLQKLALETYKKAVVSDSPDNIIQYALDSATSIMQGNKDWEGISKIHTEIIKRKPDSVMALLSAAQVAKMKIRENKAEEAVQILSDAIKPRFNDPSNEQVEFLIDELVKTFIPPRKKPSELNIDELDAKLTDALNKISEGQENATTNARIYFARARLALLLRRTDVHNLHLKGIAMINKNDPTVLSPSLLAASGDILLKDGDLESSEGMYKRLQERYSNGMFADAGPVGLGYVALARKQYDEALKIFSDALDDNPGMSRFKEANLGKMQAMIELGQLETAEKFGKEIVGDKSFRGETSAKIYLMLGRIQRELAKKASSPDKKKEHLSTAVALYGRPILASQAFPEVCAEAYWQAYETCLEQGDKAAADEYLDKLVNHPKLTNTSRYKQAQDLKK